jgi:hypothetical protein
VQLRAVANDQSEPRESGGKSAKSPRNAAKARDSVHVHVLRRLDELEKSNAKLRKAVAGLAG